MNNLKIVCAIRDMITLICFTCLSIASDKWWIIFFSYIFMTSWKCFEDDEK